MPLRASPWVSRVFLLRPNWSDGERQEGGDWVVAGGGWQVSIREALSPKLSICCMLMLVFCLILLCVMIKFVF